MLTIEGKLSPKCRGYAPDRVGLSTIQVWAVTAGQEEDRALSESALLNPAAKVNAEAQMQAGTQYPANDR